MIVKPAFLLPGAMLVVLLLANGAQGGKKPQAAQAVPVPVDGGSFSFYLNSRRVASEKFSIVQTNGSSLTTSTLELSDGKPAQSYSLSLSPLGDLIRYEWHEQSDGKTSASIAIDPDTANGYLVEDAVLANGKKVGQTYLVPASVAILDEYFISQRELLLWRYMGAYCKDVAGKMSCPSQPQKFGTLAPLIKLSQIAAVEYRGMDVIHYKDANHKFDHFHISAESSNWSLWLDEQHKLVRVVIEDTGAEILRD